VAVVDVPTAYQQLEAAARAAGRVFVAHLNEQDRKNISAQLDFDTRRSEEGALRAILEGAGDVLSRQVDRAAESDSVTDTKVLYKVTLVSGARLKPREVMTLALEVADVEAAATLFAAQVAEGKGRQVDVKFDRDKSGQTTAKLVFDVPLAAAAGVVERFRAAGKVRVSQSVRDPQATEGKFATAQIHVSLTNVEAIVADGDGVWPKLRQGLTVSASVLLKSLKWLVFGLCVVLPWAAIALCGYRLARRFARSTQSTPSTPAATPTVAGGSAAPA
jgi:hypothetical protein